MVQGLSPFVAQRVQQTWADDGAIYVQEDRSAAGFGATIGAEVSLWKLSPETGDFARVAEMNRAAVMPEGSTEPVPADIGNRESPGDTRYLGTRIGL